MAKGQTQIIIFVLLLLITLTLVFTAVSWGSGIGQRNIDVGKITAVENWMKNLDNGIQSVVRSGGSVQIDYTTGAQVGLSDVGLNDIIEISMPTTLDLPNQWINLTTGGMSLIRERKEGADFKIQLFYPAQTNFTIDLFTDGPQIAMPRSVLVERNTTSQTTTMTIVRIRLLFI